MPGTAPKRGVRRSGWEEGGSTRFPCALQTRQPLSEGGRFSWSMPPRLRGQRTLEKSLAFGRERQRKLAPAPSQRRVVPAAGEGCGTGCTDPGERVLEE